MTTPSFAILYTSSGTPSSETDYTTTTTKVVTGLYLSGAKTGFATSIQTLYPSGTAQSTQTIAAVSTSFPVGTTTLTLLSIVPVSGPTTDLFLGPLTEFNPPPSCLANLYFNLSTPIPRLGWPTQSQCYPSGFTEPPSQQTRPYYSPGVCPSAYSTACSVTDSPHVYVCCPSGFRCHSQGENENMCTKVITSATFARDAEQTALELVVPAFETVYAPVIRIRYDDPTSTADPTRGGTPAQNTPPSDGPQRPTVGDMIINSLVNAMVALAIIVLLGQVMNLYLRWKAQRLAACEEEGVVGHQVFHESSIEAGAELGGVTGGGGGVSKDNDRKLGEDNEGDTSKI